MRREPRPGRRRTGANAWAAVAAALLTGCSALVTSAPEPDSSAPAPSPSQQPLTPATRPPLSAEELDSVTFKTSELPQSASREVREGEEAYSDPKKQSFYSLLPAPECQAVRDLEAPEEAAAQVVQTYQWSGDLVPGFIWLSSYRGTQAKDVLARARTAVRACAAGGPGRLNGVTVRLKQHSPQKAPDAGDESLSWRITSSARGAKAIMEYRLLREGRATVMILRCATGSPRMFPGSLTKILVERLDGALRSGLMPTHDPEDRADT
ncbi:hypothetical protein ACWGJ2_36815 [Streptomyces sp. NPDC054796]